jgi:hypothetical protein
MMNTDRIKEIRSREVSEILSHSPHWIISRGLGLVFLSFLFLAGISCFIKIPDVTVQKFSLISENETLHSVRLRIVQNKDLLDKLEYCKNLNIAFNEFPPDTFGVLQAEVSNILNIGTNRFLDLELFLPDGYISSHKIRLHPAVEMKGNLIIFHQSSLMKRIIDTIGIHNKS